ncbi:hypothetical protein K1719_010025 [Acacia pycnantha]|nr:hypothetical protein K1719_010025 [Acacia pycnantha]
MDVIVEFQMTALSLYHSSQQGDWKEALTTFKNNPGIHEMPINSSADTLLHVALNDYKDDWAEQIVDEIKKNQSWSVLGRKNDRGDTPLHCAASIGSLKMCKAIAEAQGSADSQLMIEARNKEGETPLFLAALHGHNDAFLYLHFCCPDQFSRLWQRNDGETVLHCTIRREHFDLAFQIILLYKRDIVGVVDEKGISPLHILASKPSAFASSSNFRWYNKLVYNCLIVKPLMGSLEQQSNNNDTLLNRTGADTENPGYVGYNNVAPPNYWRCCCDILVRLFICFIQPLVETFGLQYIEHLKKKKQKHVWCRQILDEIWVYKDVAYIGGGSAFRGYPLLGTVENFPKAGDHQISAIQDEKNKEIKKVDVDHNKSKDEKNKEIKKVYVDHNEPKELEELLTSLFKGKTSVSASKSLTGCCIFLGDWEKKEESDKKESAFFIAAKNGVLEILEKIMKDKPGAIHETNSQGQNVLHVAVESRQSHVFNLFKELLLKERMWYALVQNVDCNGNNILHTAAKSIFQIQGSSALQMQHDIKWYQYVKSFVPSYVKFLPNNEGKTPKDIFLGDHKDLVQKSDEWLSRTSESCSVVAALVAGVAFATSSTVPGGNDDKTGKPTLEGRPGFDIFAITALIALCLSVTALILFLSILTSRKQAADYMKKLPVKLFLALSSLFVSIFSMFISFCAAHSFVLEEKSKKSVLPIYAIICLPVSFTIAEFPLYMDLLQGIFMKVQRPYDQRST